MLNIGMREALHLWSELEKAYYGDNGYGTYVAELYAYRFGEHGPYPRFDTEWKKEENLASSRSLYELLLEFKNHKDCDIKVEDREFGDWILKEEFDHRVHVEVIRKKPWILEEIIEERIKKLYRRD